MKRNQLYTFKVSAVSLMVCLVTFLMTSGQLMAQGGGISVLEISGEQNPNVDQTITYTLSAAPTPYGTITWEVGAAGLIISSNQTQCEVKWIAAGSSHIKASETGADYTVTHLVNVAGSNGSTGAGTNTILQALNLARSYQVKNPGLATYDTVRIETDPSNVVVQSAYFDGLGRPKQTVVRQITPNNKDFVSTVIYNKLGQVVQQYLPYEASTTNGTFKDDLTDRGLFYTSQYGEDTHPYSTMVYELSPLNRVVQNTGPGEKWHNNNKSVNTSYRFNTDVEGIFKWVSTTKDTVYEANELMVTETTDEDGKQIRLYTNERGQVILKKVQEAANPGANHGDWLNTYYVYNAQEQLSVVIPPKAVALVPEGGNSFDLTNEVINELCFQYDYDNRGRMIAKRVPGTDDFVRMVYDKQNRLVLTQDPRQAVAGEWIFTRYDALSRPVMTGVYKSTQSRSELQGLMNTATVHDMFIANPVNSIIADELVVSHHEDGVSLYEARNYIEFKSGVQIYSNVHGTVDALINTSSTASGNYLMGYYDAAEPELDEDDRIETVTYYDNYNFTDKAFNSSYNSEMTSGLYLETPAVVTDANGKATAQGQVTSSRTRIFGTDQWLESVIFYDKKGRVIQTQGDNHNGGIDIVTNTYDFSGKVLYTYTHHKNPKANDFTELRVLKKFTYDHADRLIKVESRNVNEEVDYTIIAENNYDAISQLTEKKLGNAEQTLDYNYNIRGWMADINDASALGTDYFAMQLVYNAAGQYNGNIGAVNWKSVSDTDNKRYDFSYDQLNRLTQATYTNETDAAFNNDFDMDATYDENGNILSLNRRGRVGGTAKQIDVLSYSYASTSNKLIAVTDSGGDNHIGDFADGNNISGNDYNYDANGNMIADTNKDITSIVYNRLNLPATINFVGGHRIEYMYDATGIKLRKTVVEVGGSSKVTDYINGFTYGDNNLQQFGHEEGRVRKTDQGNLVYDYVIKDHLGNTRVTFSTDKPETVYRATMEQELGTDEESYFLNISNLREINVAANKTGSNATINGNEVIRLNGIDPNRRLGPGKMLAVTVGDEVDLEVYGYYAGTPGTNSPIANLAFATLIGNAFGGSATGTEHQQTIQNSFENNLASVVPSTGTGNNTAIKAYLNYVLFDDDFDEIDAGFVRVDQGIIEDSHRLLQINDIAISKSGFLYVYTSNEGDVDFNVYFDELEIKHTSGGILQEDHYYPFGMNINALSSIVPLSRQNNYKYNGFEEQTEFGLGWYDYQARNYDPQIGRWFNIDPATDLMRRHSPYNYAFDNPIRFVDPDGMMPNDTVEGEGNSSTEEGGENDQECDEECQKRKLEEARANGVMQVIYQSDNTRNVQFDTVMSNAGLEQTVAEFQKEIKEILGLLDKGHKATELLYKLSSTDFQTRFHSLSKIGPIGDVLTFLTVVNDLRGPKTPQEKALILAEELVKFGFGKGLGYATYGELMIIIDLTKFVAEPRLDEMARKDLALAQHWMRVGYLYQKNGNERIAKQYFEKAAARQNRGANGLNRKKLKPWFQR